MPCTAVGFPGCIHAPSQTMTTAGEHAAGMRWMEYGAASVVHLLAVPTPAQPSIASRLGAGGGELA